METTVEPVCTSLMRTRNRHHHRLPGRVGCYKSTRNKRNVQVRSEEKQGWNLKTTRKDKASARRSEFMDHNEEHRVAAVLSGLISARSEATSVIAPSYKPITLRVNPTSPRN